jgi:DNA-binding response OmpR family regulator
MNSNPCILVIEDNQQNLKLLGDLLTDAGYQLSIANCAEQTYSILKVLKPDLILLDIMLPKTDGYEICKTIKSDPNLSHIPIIVNSALFNAEDRIKAFDMGASDFISKPYYTEEILKRIQVHLSYTQNRSSYDPLTNHQKDLSTSLNAAIKFIEPHTTNLENPLLELKLNGIIEELRSAASTLT